MRICRTISVYAGIVFGIHQFVKVSFSAQKRKVLGTLSTIKK